MPVYHTQSFAEKKVIEAIEEQLKAPYETLASTNYVYNEPGGPLRDGEFDIMIFHPSQGILLIEVKGGGISYEGERKQWYSIDRYNRSHPIKDPFEQAQKAARWLHKSLKEAGIERGYVVPIAVGHAVSFPDVHWHDAPLPAHASKDVILDSARMNRLGDAIPSVMSLYRAEGQTGLDERECGIVRSRILYPTCSIMPTMKSGIEQDERQLVRMTREQFHLLDFLDETRQIAIRGYAGTGKTLLAMEKARRLYYQGLNVALVCFNRPLADQLAKELISFSDRIIVKNYHVLARELCREAEIPFEIPSGDADQSQLFWDKEAPIKMIEAIGKTCRKFDAIIVDEGQDFHPDWWKTLNALLADPVNGYLYIFFDANQNIYRDEIKLPVPIAPLVLSTNCRNTKNIGLLVSRLGGVKMKWPDDAVKGQNPKFIPYSSDKEQADKIQELVKRLIEKEQLDPQDMVILSTHSRKNSCLSEISDIAGIPLTEELLIPENKIRFASLYRFKGLEANVVILCDVEADDERSHPENLYVATSRAKHMIYIFHDSAWKLPEEKN